MGTLDIFDNIEDIEEFKKVYDELIELSYTLADVICCTDEDKWDDIISTWFEDNAIPFNETAAKYAKQIEKKA
jgi:hypothetical protein